MTVVPALAGGLFPSASSDAPPPLERCDQTLGVLRIQEDTNSDWYRYYGSRLGSTAPLLSALVMDSNCFIVVERGTGERGLNDETARARGDEARESATRGKGQQMVADYLLNPEIVRNNKGGDGVNLGGLLRKLPGVGAIGMKSNEADAVLTLIDIRSTARLAAGRGHAESRDINLSGVSWGHSGLLGGSAYTTTDEGKMIAAAFADAYNKLVVGLRNYKAQTVKGGAGNGGLLGVQGGITEASKQVGK